MNMLKLTPLGGLGEIGLNMMVVEYNSTILIIDSGLMFPESHMLGINYIIPNMKYLKNNKKKISALIITHSHEDHIGAIPFLIKKFNIPIFAAKFAIEVIKCKLKKHNFYDKISLNKINFKKKLKINSFEIDFIKVSHSTIESLSLVIKTPIGVVIHSGDFKIDHSNNKKYCDNLKSSLHYCKKKVLALLSDSTNIEKKGYSANSKIMINKLFKMIEKNNGRIIIALFSSNISRIKQIVKIAKQVNRKVLFIGKSLELSVKIAKKIGYIKIPKNMETCLDEVKSISCNKIIIITTGSQGEPMSALTRMAYKKHKKIIIQENDTVILSSKFIPGNEKIISNIINKLYKNGANVIYEKISDIHVSGHAYREELKFIMHITNPKFLIPIHGEYRHLYLHCKMAREYGFENYRTILINNGETINFNKNSYKISKNTNFGRVLIDNKSTGNEKEKVIKERQTLSKNGFIAINIIFDEESGVIKQGPKLISKGISFECQIEGLLTNVRCIILELLEEIGHNVPNRIDKIKSHIKNTLNQYFYYSFRRKPAVILFISEI